MGRLFDRFSTNSTQNDAMHSSGLIGRPQIGGRVIKRSFRQRLAISRKHVGAYDDAEVRHSYRRSWREQQITNTNGDNDDDDKQTNPTQMPSSRVSGASSPAEAKRMNQQTSSSSSSAPSSRAAPTTEAIKPRRDHDPFNR